MVITNPTHYAVALAYEMKTMAAPKVVAKGVDVLARRIREVAEANGVPIVENPPLARALHGSVEVDDEIRPNIIKQLLRSSDTLCGQETAVSRPNHLQAKAAGTGRDCADELSLTIGAGLAEDLLQMLPDSLIGKAELLRRLL